jgi:UDP-sugar pyrophosphorylase
MSTFLASLGVSAAHELALNIVAMPRKAKEAIGVVARLTHTDGRTAVATVEYNQLEPLLLATGFSQGDVNETDSGFSRFPGNINEIVLHMDSYLDVLAVTAGHVDEFVNPKFADGARSTFKSPTRLECMMQDFAKTVMPHHRVGFTQYPIEFGYFPCKNDIDTAARLSAQGVPPHSASTAEFAVYRMHASALRRLGAAVEPLVPRQIRGITVEAGAVVVLEPSFAPCTTILASRLLCPASIRISRRSALVVRGAGVTIRSLVLDGALEIEAEPGASIDVRSLLVRNRGWEFRELSDAEMAASDEKTAIRGFGVHKHDTRRIVARAGEALVVDEGTPA